MLNCEELLEKLNSNPDIEPWFKETLTALIPRGFEAIEIMYGEKRTREMLNKTAWIVERTVMRLDDLNKSENTKDLDENGEKDSKDKIRTSTGGIWNGGFIKQGEKEIYSGAFKSQNGQPNFRGELLIDKNDPEKVQDLIHEFFGHLIVQVVEPQKIGDKNYAIDGFYMFELSEEGEKVGTKNKIIAEGFAELTAENVALACNNIPYEISSLYSNGHRTAKMLCQATNNKALEYNLKGIPHFLQQDMDKLLGDGSWKDFSELLSLDFRIANPETKHMFTNLNKSIPKSILTDAQFYVNQYFSKSCNFANLSLNDFYSKMQSFENSSLVQDNVLTGNFRKLADSKYIDTSLGNEYSTSEKIKHTFALNRIHDELYDVDKKYTEYLIQSLPSMHISTLSKEEFIDSLFSNITTNLKKDKEGLFNTSISFSEDVPNCDFNQSIMFTKSDEETKVSFIKFFSDSLYRKTKNYLSDITRNSEIKLDESTNLHTTEQESECHKFVKQNLYQEYSKDNRLTKYFKTKMNKIKESDIPESHIFAPGNSESIYIISQIGQDQFEVHYMERFKGNTFKKLSLSQPQKVGENSRKRDLSFMCPKSKEGAGQQPTTPQHQNPTKSIHDFVSKETTAQH